MEEVGRKLYQNNFINFEKKNKKRKFNLEALEGLEKNAQFGDFLKEIIKYIYKESNEDSIEGVIDLFELIATKFKLPISIKNLSIWKRG